MSNFFTVIVPIYRVEPYLRQCVDSILSQSEPDFELILVDDGSPDNCPSICDSYQAKDRRVKVIHQPNGGLVRARQAGIRAATGQYVLNVDGDDWLYPETLSHCRKKLEQYEPDFLSFGQTEEHDGWTKTLYEPVKAGLYGEREIQGQIYPRVLMDQQMKHMCYNLCGKAIRRELLVRHQLAVNPQISFGEDLVCMLSLYQEAKTMYISRHNGYAYRQRPASMTRENDFLRAKREAILLQELETLDRGVIGDYRAQLDRYGVAVCFWQLSVLAAGGGRKQIPAFAEYMNTPVLRKHIQGGHFANLTPKMRITCFLLQKGQMRAAYTFLRLCQGLKRRGDGG